MIKIIKNFIIFFLLLITFSCGYTSMYKNVKNLDFDIFIVEIIGDREVNNLIQSKLRSYSQDGNSKKFDITINTSYQKDIIARDTTGAALEYKISINAIFNINHLELNKELKIKESFNMKKIDDKLEEKDYELSIKKSLTNIISRKLILQISQIK